MGCRVLTHTKPATRQSWDYRAMQGFYVCPALDHYRCHKLVKSETKQKVISDTVKFRHAYLQIPAVLVEDKIINGLQVMAGALQNAPPPRSSHQLNAIETLRMLLQKCKHLAPPVFTAIQRAPHMCHQLQCLAGSRIRPQCQISPTTCFMPCQITMTRTRLVPQHGCHPCYPLQCQEHQLHGHALHLSNRPLPQDLSLSMLLLQVGPIQPRNQAHHHFQGCL